MQERIQPLSRFVPWLIPAIGAFAASKDIHRQAADSVVYVTAPDREPYRGAGVVVDARGFLLSAYHVVGSASVAFAVPPGMDDPYDPRYRCRVVAADPARDLVLLRYEEPPPGLRALPLASRSTPGQEVFTIGRSGLSGGRVRRVCDERWRYPTGQAVSARVVETAMNLAAGDSGGPIIGEGGIVGINAAYRDDAEFGIDVSEIRAFLGAHLEP